jgi:hypothetical protein
MAEYCPPLCEGFPSGAPILDHNMFLLGHCTSLDTTVDEVTVLLENVRQYTLKGAVMYDSVHQ